MAERTHGLVSVPQPDRVALIRERGLEQACSSKTRGESWSLVYALHEGARPTIWVIGEIAVRAGRLVCAAEHVTGSVTKMQIRQTADSQRRDSLILSNG